jgi:hypothetical protein
MQGGKPEVQVVSSFGSIPLLHDVNDESAEALERQAL